MVRPLTLLAALVVSLAAAGCAKKQVVAPEPLETTSARLPRPNVHVDRELLAACRMTLNKVERAPKFDFDDAELLPEDREILVQVARCVTEGPLAGRALSLVGRADPRGETEYNLVLGEHRAGSVQSYLSLLGVGPAQMATTSRGELDAEGTDEVGWQRDRRVDVLLVARKRADLAEGVSPVAQAR